ncbi:hypothetical protein BB558_004714 [Smittium angustum]|uniref:HTH APSES-type domain-containing protein n=1 Tax=Smittium angustum TaxID=133377 RepID=A0A2U1J2H7_SMIAN|nr:hypothetical protein BB558_004714 [Smittium angustum]
MDRNNFTPYFIRSFGNSDGTIYDNNENLPNSNGSGLETKPNVITNDGYRNLHIQHQPIDPNLIYEDSQHQKQFVFNAEPSEYDINTYGSANHVESFVGGGHPYSINSGNDMQYNRSDMASVYQQSMAKANLEYGQNLSSNMLTYSPSKMGDSEYLSYSSGGVISTDVGMRMGVGNVGISSDLYANRKNYLQGQSSYKPYGVFPYRYGQYDTSKYISTFRQGAHRNRTTRIMWEEQKTETFNVDCGGITVSRRLDNNMINGTKLLNVTQMTRGKRDGILKNEKERMVIKTGSMFLKGVWITFERAVSLAKKHQIYDSLAPLFQSNLENYAGKIGLSTSQYLTPGGNTDFMLSSTVYNPEIKPESYTVFPSNNNQDIGGVHQPYTNLTNYKSFGGIRGHGISAIQNDYQGIPGIQENKNFGIGNGPDFSNLKNSFNNFSGNELPGVDSLGDGGILGLNNNMGNGLNGIQNGQMSDRNVEYYQSDLKQFGFNHSEDQTKKEDISTFGQNKILNIDYGNSDYCSNGTTYIENPSKIDVYDGRENPSREGQNYLEGVGSNENRETRIPYEQSFVDGYNFNVIAAVNSGERKGEKESGQITMMRLPNNQGFGYEGGDGEAGGY